jgi:prepilin-type N-terminal cleavage/methylation domain-containing protein
MSIRDPAEAQYKTPSPSPESAPINNKNKTMKLTTNRTRKGFTLVELLVVIAIIVALASLATPAVFRALKQAAMAENVSNGRQVKMTMDAYAMDHDGVFPNEDEAEFYEISGSDTSNDLFKQLFAGEYTDSERIFWVKGSQVTKSGRPDDVTTVGGKFNANKTLEAGDCGWAYVKEQSNTDNANRPILFDCPPTGSGLEFDPDLWGKKAVVVRIDGVVKPELLNPTNKLLDGDNKQLLTTASEVWGSATANIDIAYPLKAPRKN